MNDSNQIRETVIMNTRERARMNAQYVREISDLDLLDRILPAKQSLQHRITMTEQEAYQAGMDAYWNESRKNPFAYRSPQWEAWNRGWVAARDSDE